MGRKKREQKTERRSEDQDAALADAFVAGTLPEEDRRAGNPDFPEEGPPNVEVEAPPVPVEATNVAGRQSVEPSEPEPTPAVVHAADAFPPNIWVNRG